MANKHTAEHSNTGCLGVDCPVCDMYSAHITIKPEVSIFLREIQLYYSRYKIKSIYCFDSGIKEFYE